MHNNDDLKLHFLARHFMNTHFSVHKMPSDASFRRYDRVISGDHSYILMDASTEYYHLSDFVNIAKFLRRHHFSAPQLFEIDYDNGFLLLEDFGNTTIKQHLSTAADKSIIYQQMLDLLILLQSIKPPILPIYTNNLLLKELELFIDWYFPWVTGKFLTDNKKEEFFNIWLSIINQLPVQYSQTIVLRDYHVENIMLLSQYYGIKSLGLLDFQDALIGSPIYDVVSLLEDARCDVEKAFASQMLKYYIERNHNLNNLSIEDIYTSYHILGAQRNSRILGIFARKIARDQQEHYAGYIPRVQQYLENDLSHNVLKELKSWIQKNV